MSFREREREPDVCVGVCVLLLKLISSFITFRSVECGGQKDDPSSSPERRRGRGGEGGMTDGQTGANWG